MKGIKKTLIAGAFACTAFNAHAEVSPWAYGLTVGGGISSCMAYGSEVKISNKPVERDIMGGISGGAGLFVEYAVTDYIGVGAHVRYMNQNVALTAEQEKKEEQEKDKKNNGSINISSHNLVAPLYLSIYPMGREDELGILTVKLGPSVTYRWGTKYKVDNKELTLNDDQKKESASIAFGGTLRVGYEFSFALSIEGVYNYDFTNIFKKDMHTIFASSNSVSGFKKSNIQHAGINLGYNFAPLFCS